MTTTPEAVLDIVADLGEGAFWDHQNNRLLWVDIEKGILHLFYPSMEENISFELGKRIGTVVPIDTGGMVLALQDGIYTFFPENNSLDKKIDPEEHKPHNRFNDGKCDPAGRFWAGTMEQDGKIGEGAFYRIDKDFSYRKMIDKVSVSNGIIWSLDQTKMYYIDTPTLTVAAYDYDINSGEIQNAKVVIEIPEGMGQPDGCTIDEEGMLWIAMWGGACVTRWNPLTGKLLLKISVSAWNVTSCAFGGENLDTLFITSASIGMNEQQQERYPDAGKLFKVKPGIKGIKGNYFAT